MSQANVEIVFADTSADMVTAITMTYVEEAIGIARAAGAAGVPAAISFPSRPMGAYPAVKRSARRSSRSTRRPAAAQATT
jgi:S-methylmethionine-dependent homocysteine/selenocysteine methylase